MEIKYADISDSPVIHELMIKAFSEYKEEVPPSSALEETPESVKMAFMQGERGLICYLDEQPVGMVRFKITEKGLYFYRLSVLPERQGMGFAKKILNALEGLALEKEVPVIYCKVRLNVPRNIYLYTSIGFSVYDEEVVQKPNGIHIKVASMMKKIG